MGVMQPKSDALLLRDYAERGLEASFSELVHRYTNLVYSCALRQVESPDAAAEIAQRVFIGLARGAQALSPRLAADASLAGWLCRSARNLSLNFRRDEFRRQTRERQAMEQLISIPEDAPDWERLRRVLDEAMSELTEADYDALVLRFFQNQDFRAIGKAIGVTDDTAQKRVARALEKLRGHLSQRGIHTTAAALSILIAANAVQSAPAGLAAAISAAALLTGTAVTTTTTVAVAASKTAIMTTLQKVLISVTVAALAGGEIYEARQAARLREENAILQQQQADQIRRLKQERDQATSRLADLPTDKSPGKPNADSLELLKLRGEIGVLRQQKSELEQLVSGLRSVAGKNQPEYPTNSIPRAAWGFAGYDTPEAAQQSILWAKSSGNEQLWLSGLGTNMVGWLTNSYVQGKSEEERSQFLVSQTKDWTDLRILREIPIDNDTLLMQLELNWQTEGKTGSHVSVEDMKRIDGQWKCVNEYN